MPCHTIIARVSDGLPLVASMDAEAGSSSPELEAYKDKAKAIIKQLSPSSPQKCTIAHTEYNFLYVIDKGVCFLTIEEKSYPTKLSYSFLDELRKEFMNLHQSEVDNPDLRPYAFIKFDTFMQKTRKLYTDSRARRNLEKLNDELQGVQQVMQRNFEDILGRGEKLESVSARSTLLSAESQKYKSTAAHLNTLALYRKYGPFVIVIAVVLILLYFRKMLA